MHPLFARLLKHPATHAAAEVLVRDVVERYIPAYRETHWGVEDPEAMLGAQLPHAAEQGLPPHLVTLGACTMVTFRVNGASHEIKFPRPYPWLLFELNEADEYNELHLHRGKSTYAVRADDDAPIGTLTRIGDLTKIAYVTRKGEDAPEAIDEFVHDFAEPYPWLCVRRGKRNDLAIVRGESQYDVTAHGIER
jgi:hypothetical protein